MHNEKKMLLWSGGKEIKDGQISLLAVAETVLASFFGLWFWVWLGLPILVLTSLIGSCFLLLKNPHSIRLALLKWRKYEKKLLSDERKKEGGVLFLYALIFWIFFTIYVGGFLIDRFEFGAWAYAISLVSAIFVWVALDVAFAAGTFLDRKKPVATSILDFKGDIPILIIGAFLRAVYIRMSATVRYLRLGVFEFPNNWSKLALSTDVGTPLEFVPGISPTSPFALSKISQISNDQDTDATAVKIIAFVTLYFPVFLLRFSLKSTAWAFWPLLWITSSPQKLHRESGTIIWDKWQGKSAGAYLFVFVALCTVAGYVYRLFSLPLFDTLRSTAEEAELPTYWLFYASGIDWTRLYLWDAPILANAILTFAIFIYARRLHWLVEHYETSKPPKFQIQAIFHMLWLHKFLSWLIISISIGVLIWALHQTCAFPGVIQLYFSGVFASQTSC